MKSEYLSSKGFCFVLLALTYVKLETTVDLKAIPDPTESYVFTPGQNTELAL